MALTGRGDKFVGHINLGAVGIELSVGADDAVEREHHGLADIAAMGDGGGNAVGDKLSPGSKISCWVTPKLCR